MNDEMLVFEISEKLRNDAKKTRQFRCGCDIIVNTWMNLCLDKMPMTSSVEIEGTKFEKMWNFGNQLRQQKS